MAGSIAMRNQVASFTHYTTPTLHTDYVTPSGLDIYFIYSYNNSTLSGWRHFVDYSYGW